MLRLSLAVLALASAATAQPLPAHVDSLARAFMAETGAPSLVVAVSRGGVRAVAGYGSVDGAPPDASTRYEIGSVTKTFTALALADAVVRGEVSLDTPAQTLLPDSVRLAVSGRPVTLADLATHTAGLPRLPVPFAPAVFLDPYADYTEARLMAFVGSVRPDSAGSAYTYSNVGFGLLGWLLSRREHTSYEGFIQRHVLGPLALGSTSAGGEVAPPRLASGSPLAAWTITDALAGAGALRSNAADLLTLAEALARPEERAPALAEAIRLAVTPRFSVPGRFRIGLAWKLRPEAGPVEAAFHNGATFGTVSFVGVALEKDVAVVVLSNVGANEAADRLGSGVLQAVTAEE